MGAIGTIGTLVVELTGDGSMYFKMLEEAQSGTEGLADGLGKAFGGAVEVIAAALVAITALSVKAFSDMESALVQSTANMQGATADMRQEMMNTAIELSGDGVSSAEELAQAYGSLQRNGKDAAQALVDIKVADTFAIASHQEAAAAANELARAQNAVALSSRNAAEDGRSMAQVSNTIVAAARVGNSSIQDFAGAIADSGVQIRMLSGGLEEGAAIIAAFTSQGKSASEASGNLNQVLRQLQTAVETHASVWRDFGLSVYDAQGKMLPMTDILSQLEGNFASLSAEQQRDELTQLGFQTRTIQVVQSMIGLSGAISDNITAIHNMGDASQEVAKDQMHTFSEEATIMWNNISNIFTIIGSYLVPVLEVLNSTILKPLLDSWKGNSAATKEFATILQDVLVVAIDAAIGVVTLLKEGYYGMNLMVDESVKWLFALYLAGDVAWEALKVGARAMWTGIQMDFDLGKAAILNTFAALADGWNKLAPKELKIDTSGLHSSVQSAYDDFAKLEKQGVGSTEALKKAHRDFDDYMDSVASGYDAMSRDEDSLLDKMKSTWNGGAAAIDNFNAHVEKAVAAQKPFHDAAAATSAAVEKINDDNYECISSMDAVIARSPDMEKLVAAIAEPWEKDSESVIKFTRALASGESSIMQYGKAMLTLAGNNLEKIFEQNVEGVGQDPLKQLKSDQTQELALYKKQSDLILANTTLSESRKNEIIKQFHDAQVAEELTYSQQRTKIIADEANLIVSSMANAWDSLTQDTEAAFGKQSGIYEAMFLVSRTFAAAQAVINAILASTQVLASPTTFDFVSKTTLSSAILAIGLSDAALIEGTAIGQTAASFDGGGIIEDGPRMGGVDGKGGKWMIGHPGEEILDPSKKGPNTGGMVGTNLNVTVVNQHPDAQVTATKSSDGKNVQVLIRQMDKALASNIRQGKGETHRAISQTFGAKRVGQG